MPGSGSSCSCLFVALAVVAGRWASGAFDSQPTPTQSPTVSKVEVPDTSGQDEESAKKTIEDAGLKFAKDEVANEEVSAGLAVSSDPGKGTKVESGSTVTVHFSTGSAMVKVPDLAARPRRTPARPSRTPGSREATPPRRTPPRSRRTGSSTPTRRRGAPLRVVPR